MDKTKQNNQYSVLIIDSDFKISSIIKSIVEISLYQHCNTLKNAPKCYVEHFKTYKVFFDTILINKDYIDANEDYSFSSFLNDIYTTNPFQNIIIYSNTYNNETNEKIIKFGINYHINNPTNIKNFDYSYENISDVDLFTFESLLNSSFSVLKNHYQSAILSLDDDKTHFAFQSCITYSSTSDSILCKISMEEKLLDSIALELCGIIEEEEKESLYKSICDEFNNIITGLAIQFIAAFYPKITLGTPIECDTIYTDSFQNFSYTKTIQTIHGALCLQLKK